MVDGVGFEINLPIIFVGFLAGRHVSVFENQYLQCGEHLPQDRYGDRAPLIELSISAAGNEQRVRVSGSEDAINTKSLKG